MCLESGRVHDGCSYMWPSWRVVLSSGCRWGANPCAPNPAFLACCRSLRMVLTLRWKLRGPAVAFTRYNPAVSPWRKADFLPQVGDPCGFP